MTETLLGVIRDAEKILKTYEQTQSQTLTPIEYLAKDLKQIDKILDENLNQNLTQQ